MLIKLLTRSVSRLSRLSFRMHQFCEIYVENVCAELDFCVNFLCINNMFVGSPKSQIR